jgi:hypothetical protein
MVPQRSRRLRLLESLRRTINEMLHVRVQRLAQARGHGAPQNTSSIYTSASQEAPELLDQLFFVHRRVGEEMGEEVDPNIPDRLDDRRRKAMLSAVRAAVNRSRAGLESWSNE